MEKRKLGINTAAGILDIIGAIVFPLSFWFIVGGALVDTADIMGGGSGMGATSGAAAFFTFLAIAGLVLHIVALVKSKKENIDTTGHILGIIANAIFIIGFPFRGTIAMILLILAAIFTLKQKNLDVSN